MKKILVVLLSFLMVLVGSLFAKADALNETLDLTENRAYESASQLCWIGETLYILGNEGLYTWQQDKGMTMLIDMKDFAQLRYSDVAPDDPAQKGVWEKTIHFMFSDGETVYGFQQYCGNVYRLEGQAWVLSYTFSTDKLYAEADGQRFFRGIRDVAWESGKLFLLLGTDDQEKWDKTELVAYEPQAAALTSCGIEYVESMSTGSPGTLLLTQKEPDSESTVVNQFDATTGSLQPIPSMPAATQGGITWWEAGQSYVYCQNAQVIKQSANGDAQTKAYLPISSNGALTTKLACSKAGLLATASGRYIFIRDIAADGEAQQIVLRLYGDISSDTLVQFSLANPNIAVVPASLSSGGTFQEAVLSAGADVDLFVTNAPGPFADMKAKGYTASMNASETLTEQAKHLYPSIQEAIFEGDNLMAYPIGAIPYSWSVNETLWQRFGLEAYPRTYQELFDYMDMWADDYAQDNPDYKFFDMQQDFEGFVTMLIREYILQTETPEKPVIFDTPTFRDALAAVIEHQSMIEESLEQYGMPVLYSYSMGFGVAQIDGEKTIMLLPPALNADEQALTTNLSLIVLNPASQHQAEALKLVEFVAERTDIPTQYMMNPSLNTAMRPENYDARVAQVQQEIADLEAQCATAEGETLQAIDEGVAMKKANLERMAADMWLVSQDSIDCYRSLAEHLRVPYQTLYLSDEGNSGMQTLLPVIQRFCGQGLDVDAFVRELDRVAQMVFAESM